jgi:hypothetical protein
MTCEACHLNGRGNDHFSFPGLSGAAGTADVTSSLMSTHRNDGADNPKAIPDLGGFGKALLVVRTAMRPDLRNFIENAITEEFDGAPPPKAVLDGLADYTRALAPDHCPRPLTERVTLAGELSDVRRAVRAAQGALARNDRETAMAMIEAARAMLGRIHERFSPVPLAAERRELERADQTLVVAQAALRAGRAPQLAAWLETVGRLEAALSRQEARSLYAPAELGKVYAAK